MASQQQVSNLFKTLGGRIADAHNAAKDIPVNLGGGVGLPAGINNGIAQLTVLEFIEGKKEDDKGKFYFRAAGVMKSPEYHDGIKVRGKQTSVLIPFFDTPKRQTKKSFVEHHWPSYRDLFAKLGVEQPPAQQPGETKEAAATRIQNYYAAATQILLDKSKPVYFEVRTWQGPKAETGPYAGREPQVNETWGGRCEYNETGAAVNPAAAMTPAAPTVNGHASAPTAMTQPKPAELKPEPFTEPPQAAPSSELDESELLMLAETADGDPTGETDDGKEATRKLSEVCEKYGITNEEAAALPDWNSVVALIMSKASGGGGVSSPKADPVKGGMVIYNGQTCEVTSVNPTARTVTLKGPDKKAVVGADKKLLKVPFDQLS